MRRSLLIFVMTWILLVLAACSRKRGETIIIPANHRAFYLKIADLEPPTFSRLATVDWEIVTTNATISGSSPVVQGSDLNIAFPGTADIVSFSLHGRDAGDHLRAEGMVSGSALNASTATDPAVLLFPLYGDFQAYPASAGPNLAFSAIYIDSSGAPVLVGGSEQFPTGTPKVIDDVQRFDPITGEATTLGHLKTPRANFTFARKLYFSVQTHEDIVVGGGKNSIEVWDRIAHTSTSVNVTLACPRLQPSIVPYVSASRYHFLILGGNACGSSAAGENLDFVGPALTGLTTVFDSSAPDAIFASGTLPATVTFYQWFGNSSTAGNQGRTYQSSSANSTGTFSAPAQVNSRVFTPHLNNYVLWPGAVDPGGFCRSAVEISAAPPVTASYTWGEDICAPALAPLDGDDVFVLGGTLGMIATIRDSVKIFQFSTNSLRDALTPDGVPMHLAYPRQNATAVTLPNGRVIVLGGITADRGTHPRVEIMIPAP